MSEFLNHYHCVDCDIEWDDKWDCMCNDRCESCGREIEPHEPGEVFHEEIP